tara:strand:+ start:168 stop:362 length:195 start_codon:yes stop_codon:yes gene_type:complete
MIEILIATAVTCADVSEMVDRIRANNTVDSETKQELVEMYEVDFTEVLDLECDFETQKTTEGTV